MKHRPIAASAQRGAALLTAMIIVTLVATLASAMIWQQWRAVQVETAERARLQSSWILSGALDWARLILREDAKSGGADHLGEPWAVPLAEARLSTFLAVDKNNAEDAPDAFLSGTITDAQSHYNLRNLVGEDNKVADLEVKALKRLFQAINVTPELADTIANGLRDALAPPEASARSKSVPLMPQRVSQLAWLGIDAESIQRMTPYVALLPERTAVNLNTAPKEVLIAAIDGLDLGTAERLVQVRQRSPFKSIAEAKTHMPATLEPAPQRAGTVSKFFEVRGRLRLEDRVLEESSLVERRGLDIIPLSRQRESSRESTG
ncbi:MAG TPA: type II secretion system minor pseudopilin GspK [Albitalea sp.]|uniref:type II secretion system minor pseudopilin GspK n=1 Tax=Piscinibacter sp. TaxID=1903157 RepID=UPI002ED4E076